MIDENRMKEVESNIQQYLQDGLLKKEKFQDLVYKTYMRNHQESLDVAKKLIESGVSSLWVIVVSYYSMFYITNAVLYKMGYKVGHKVAHKVTADALMFYIRNKLKKSVLENYEEAKEEALELAGLQTDELLQSFDYERMKRSKFQYETTDVIKESKAKTSFDRAKKFAFEMEKLLQNFR